MIGIYSKPDPKVQHQTSSFSWRYLVSTYFRCWCCYFCWSGGYSPYFHYLQHFKHTPEYIVNKYAMNFFTERVITKWNKLPLEVKTAEDTSTFKITMASTIEKWRKMKKKYWKRTAEHCLYTQICAFAVIFCNIVICQCSRDYLKIKLKPNDSIKLPRMKPKWLLTFVAPVFLESKRCFYVWHQPNCSLFSRAIRCKFMLFIQYTAEHDSNPWPLVHEYSNHNKGSSIPS